MAQQVCSPCPVSVLKGFFLPADFNQRGLEFTALALRKNVSTEKEELAASFTSSYESTLKKHHNFVVKGIFTLAMKACPYRTDFYKKLGEDQTRVNTQLVEWLGALEKIVEINNTFLAAKNIK